MKKLIILSLIAGLFIACDSTNNNNEAKTSKAEEVAEQTASNEYIVDTEHSIIKWWGSKPTGVHHGTIRISSGSFGVENGKVVSGKVIIDMNSIKVVDMNEEKNAKLGGHLKSGDFFLTEKYPNANFELIKSDEGVLKSIEIGKTDTLTKTTNIINGNLSIKDSTKKITFLGDLAVSDSSIHLISDSFSIDRTKWGVIYKSTSFYSELGEKFIDDKVGLIIDLKAKK